MTDNVHGDDDTPEGHEDMTVAEAVDGTKMTWDQVMTQTWAANVKAMFEQHLRDGEREREQKNFSDALAQRVAEQQNALVSMIQTNAATLANRQAQNSATVDHLANMAGLAQLSEYRGIGAQVAQEASEAATAAVNSALAQTAQTSAAAQGTTGLAQGAIQAGTAGVNVALLANMTEVMAAIGASLVNVESALRVILLKVVGQEVVEETPA